MNGNIRSIAEISLIEEYKRIEEIQYLYLYIYFFFFDKRGKSLTAIEVNIE
jgi:hypothetical protein